MTTGNDLVSGAIQQITSLTPGEAIPGQEASDALAVLNRMLKFWSAKRYMIPYRTLESFSLTSGIGSRTIGSGAQFDTVRPDRITGAYLRDSGGNDDPVDVLMTSGEYNAIGLKTNTGRPRRLYYDKQYPNGVIYFDLVTDAAYTLYLESLKPVNQFTTLQTTISLPPEYEEPIVYLLAHRLAPMYGAPISDELAVLIRDAEKFIKRSNVKLVRAGFDAALTAPPPADINQG